MLSKLTESTTKPASGPVSGSDILPHVAVTFTSKCLSEPQQPSVLSQRSMHWSNVRHSAMRILAGSSLRRPFTLRDRPPQMLEATADSSCSVLRPEIQYMAAVYTH